MHSSLNRLQTTFSTLTTASLTLISIITLFSIVPFPPNFTPPTARISPGDIKIHRSAPRYKHPASELATVRFDLDLDLSGLVTWNTKQLFVWVSLSYPGSPTGTNTYIDSDGDEILVDPSEMVIWDRIIIPPATQFSLESLKDKYFPSEKVLRQRRMAEREEKNKNKKRKVTAKTTTTTGTAGKKEEEVTGKLQLKNVRPKYAVSDPSGLMAGRENVTLTVGWNIQPWVGALVWDKGILGDRVGQWSNTAGLAGVSDPFTLPLIEGGSQRAGGAAGTRSGGGVVVNNKGEQSQKAKAKQRPVIKDDPYVKPLPRVEDEEDALASEIPGDVPAKPQAEEMPHPAAPVAEETAPADRVAEQDVQGQDERRETVMERGEAAPVTGTKEEL